jgi:hypothetical protein
MTRLRGTLIAAAVPLFLLSACAQPSADGGSAASPGSGRESSAPYPQGADDLVLRTESFGGFVPPDRVVGSLPTVSVYADGRVITNGPVTAIYPGPALPNVQVQMITPELVKELVRQGSAAGVRAGTDFGRPNIADAPTTRVTVTGESGTQSVAVEALQEGRADDPMLTAGQRDARTKLATYVKKLADLPTAPGMATPVAYDAEALAVLARPWTSMNPADPPATGQAWPGPALPGTYLNPSFQIGCVVTTGADKDRVLAAAKTANVNTPWTVGKDKYLITFRPLLPDEKDCAVLKVRA